MTNLWYNIRRKISSLLAKETTPLEYMNQFARNAGYDDYESLRAFGGRMVNATADELLVIKGYDLDLDF